MNWKHNGGFYRSTKKGYNAWLASPECVSIAVTDEELPAPAPTYSKGCWVKPILLEILIRKGFFTPGDIPETGKSR